MLADSKQNPQTPGTKILNCHSILSDLSGPTLIWWMRFSPSSFIIFCLLRSMFNLGFRWGGSLADAVCWAESLHDRLHTSHTSVGLVLTKVQNWQTHCGRDQKES